MVIEINSLAKHNLISIEIDEPLQNAAHLMRENRIRHLPVNDDGEIVGLISDRDIQRATRSDIVDFFSVKVSHSTIDPSFTVRDFMSWPIKTVESTLSIREVNRRMIRDKISAFLVTDTKNVTGIVTHEDLLLYLDTLLGKEEKSGGILGSIRTLSAKSPIAELLQELSNSGI